MDKKLKIMTKKHILKPGKHQFAPGSYAVHENDNLNDEEAEWYLERYPHIASLFVDKLEGCNVEMLEHAIPKDMEDQMCANSDTRATTNENNEKQPLI
jgi:hypothetical protein